MNITQEINKVKAELVSNMEKLNDLINLANMEKLNDLINLAELNEKYNIDISDSFWLKEITRLKKDLDEGDSRYEEFIQQYIKYGFSVESTWGLNSHLANLILPRLELFAEIQLDKIQILGLDKMIEAFKLLADDKNTYPDEDDKNTYPDEDESKIIEVGLDLFAKNFSRLWW